MNILLFFSCYLGGFILSLTHSSVFAFMLYQAVYFFNPASRWWGHMVPNLSYSFFSVLLMFFVFVKGYSTHKSNRIFAAPQFKWVYFILLSYLITIIIGAAFPGANQYGINNFIKLIIIISVAYKLIDSSIKLDGVLGIYIFGAAYIGIQAYQVGRNASGRVENIGTVDSPDANGIAAAIVPTLVLSLYYFWSSKSYLVKGAAALGGALVANGIVLINSRASFLAALISISYFMFFLFFSKYKRPNQTKSALTLVFLGLLGLSMVVDQSALERFASITKEKQVAEEQEQESGYTRVFFWIAAVEVATDHPLGKGVRSFEAFADEYLPPDLDTGGSRHRSVHSSWFEALTDTGFFGLFALVMMLYTSYKTLKISRNKLGEKGDIEDMFKVIAIEAALVAYIISMTFMNRYRAEVLYWLVLFSACAYNIYVIKAESSLSSQKAARN